MENGNISNRKIRNMKKKKRKKKFVIIFSIIIFVLLVCSVTIGVFWSQLSKVKKTTMPTSNKELGIDESKLEGKQNSSDIINIALFGTDTRVKGENGNGDAEMILTIDKKNNKLKLSSIMRDSYVNVDEIGMTKINEAYARGGAKLGVKTLNENFNMDIRDYVAVNFENMAKIVDAFGGVTIDVQSNEISVINMYLHSTPGLDKSEIINVTKKGSQTLNGTQAVAYARIRYTDGGDFVRTERQRTVLTALFSKAKNGGALKAASLVTQLLPYVETSLSNTDMISLGTSILNTGLSSLEQERFPLDGYCDQLTKNGIWYLQLDLPTTTKQMHSFIYDDVKPVAGTPKF